MNTIINNRLLQHIAFWLFYVVIYYYNYKRNEPALTGLLVTLISLPAHLFFTYMQLYFLIPRFLLKRKIWLYGLFTLLFLRIAMITQWVAYSFLIEPLRTGAPKEHIYWGSLLQFNGLQVKSVFALLTICGIAVSIKLLKKWYQENERKEQAEKEKNKIELEMLKAQVHPHFLFNTLNNLYSLTLVQSKNAPVVVTHLSDLLRYMLYECNEKEVPLDKEIEVLKKYVELEKLRYGNRIDVSFVCDGNTSQLKIAPLMLLPFAENSFKHGVSEELDQCWVNIHFHAEGNNLSFHLSNSYSHNKKTSTTGGLGLSNIKKRLDLLYPGKYELSFSQDNEIYNVKLKLELSAVAAPAVNTSTNITSLKPVPAV